VFLKFAKKIWQEALMEFSDSIINKATIECRDFFELPPTLPQLLHCCRQIKKQTTFYVVKNAGVPADPIIVCQTASKIDPLSAPKIDPPLPFKLNSI